MTSASRSLARAGMIVSGAFLASRVLGWLRVVVIGNVFARDPAQLDAFYAAFRIPDLLFQLVAAGALGSALIPILAGLFASGEDDRAWRLVSTVANLLLVVLAVAGVVVWVIAPWLVSTIIAPGFDAETQALTTDLTRIMVLSPVFLALGAVASSILNARNHFAASAVAPIVYNLAIIGAALILAPSMGAVGLALGVVAGALGHILVQLPPVRGYGFRWKPVVDTRDALTRRTFGLMAPRAVGLGATQITFVVVTALATTLGVGAVTSFTIAFTLLQIPIGLIGVPLGIVLFPSMSREFAIGNVDEVRALLSRALRLVVFVLVPITALMAILPHEVVALLFPTFDPAAIDQTAVTLRAFSLGIVAHASIAVLARAFYARQDTVTPVIAAVAAVVVNTTLAWLLLAPLGLPGIALAIAIAAWLEAGILLVLLARRIHDLGLADVGSVAARTLLATVPAAVVALLLETWLADALLADAATGLRAIPGLLVTIVVVGAAFGVVFLTAALALRITELRSTLELMVDALRRPRRP